MRAGASTERIAHYTETRTNCAVILTAVSAKNQYASRDVERDVDWVTQRPTEKALD